MQIEQGGVEKFLVEVERNHVTRLLVDLQEHLLATGGVIGVAGDLELSLLQQFSHQQRNRGGAESR